jgi:nucleoside-diphosphate-sugar epimerase
MNVAVTGPNGWVAKALHLKLLRQGFSPRGVNRAWLTQQSAQDQESLFQALCSCSSIIHLAALVHQMDKAPTLSEYRAVNCELTLKLAHTAASAGVQQFIFVSTAKVMGERSSRPFLESDNPAPADAYSISKLEAEIGLRDLQKNGKLGSMKLAIIRPPLVFGEGVGANYEKLIAVANTSWPLPLGGAKAQRSMVGIDHLTDGLIAVLKSCDELNNFELFFAADPVDQSTANIIRALRQAKGHNAGLINVPPKIMQAVLSVLGKKSIYDRLFTSLQVDGTRLNDLIKKTSPLS